MKKLETTDVFAFARLLVDTGIKDELKKLLASKDDIKDLTAESLGFDIIFLIVEKASTKASEKAIYEFVGNLLEMDPEEVAHLDPTDFIEKVSDIATSEQWKSFFTSVVKLMKLN